MAEVKTTANFQDMERLVNQIVQRFQPRKIILFGSYASGTPAADSDVDLLVVMPDPPEWHHAYQVKSELQRHFPLPLQIIFMEADEFEETRNVVGGLAYPASHGGKPLYEKNP